MPSNLSWVVNVPPAERRPLIGQGLATQVDSLDQLLHKSQSVSKEAAKNRAMTTICGIKGSFGST